MGLKPITYKKNELHYIFILWVNSFREQSVCFRESDNWSMVRWTA